MAASWLEKLIEPERFQLAENSHAMAFGLSGLGAVVGGAALFFVIRRMGKAGSGLSRSEAIIGFPLGIAAFILPSAFLLAMHRGDPAGSPMISAVINITTALLCMAVLANHPWRPGEETRGSWIRVNPKQLALVPAVWLLAYIPMQLAMFASVQLHEWVQAPVAQQEVVQKLRESTSGGGMFAWYLMAVVAAPMLEEFVFRVVLFGATRRLLDGMSNREGWKHPGAWIALVTSVGVFVLAHGVVGWTVGIIPLTLLSLVLTWLYAHSKSIWPGMLYHAMHNAFVVTMQYFVLS
ncbi:MAG: CPBP family intramembrane metalloprotease [Planctomycetes bacterium]|nr:CPBP family intramembrane metalloprotease [Planctomycetota bacterium]